MNKSTNNSTLSAKPLVSISIITYNHKDFIVDAIESVLMQEVNFEYEIIIGDDFSNDGTQDILKDYEQRYPDKIQLILHPRDYDCIPGRINNITNLYACRGKYIAMLDGDDSWLSTDKLQKQVNFLEENEDFAVSFHDMMLYYQNGTIVKHSSKIAHYDQGKTVFTYKDVLSGWFIQTSSLLFRNHRIGEFPDWFWEIYSADYAIQLLAARHGKLKYFPDLFAKRNYHPQSFTATQNTTQTHLQRRKKELIFFEKYFPGYKAYQDYGQGKNRLKDALRNLKEKQLSHFPGNLTGSLVHLGKFVFNKDFSILEKVEIIDVDFIKKWKKKS
ncbi:glycosyltransferase family 2 protein [Flavimarina sp. Hel_I_48]|uniref:glycosyltransferase family 2 protein n=1 Tax=Flavimarina sp. Hel_I_48 TaxID=1392488 RepID=UPI0006915B8A|nr:glycosyltransferase family 2 protein [Flavimarina sp. Hel_I_48]